MPRRIKLTLEYFGLPFHGFQRQNDLPTVQKALEDAVKNLSGQDINIQVAGRTDKGVHAKGQVCHFDIESDLKLVTFKDGINRFTPTDITVICAEEVTTDFQARFECIGRHYEYLVWNRREESPFWRDRTALVRKPLDMAAMKEAATHFMGRHNFSTFRSPICGAKSPVTEIHHLDVEKDGHTIRFYIHGAAFLHNMVRIMCGTLVLVGQGKLSPQDISRLIEAKDRDKAPLTLPSEGLYFLQADYHPHEIVESC